MEYNLTYKNYRKFLEEYLKIQPVAFHVFEGIDYRQIIDENQIPGTVDGKHIIYFNTNQKFQALVIDGNQIEVCDAIRKFMYSSQPPKITNQHDVTYQFSDFVLEEHPDVYYEIQIKREEEILKALAKEMEKLEGRISFHEESLRDLTEKYTALVMPRYIAEMANNTTNAISETKLKENDKNNTNSLTINDDGDTTNA